MATLVCGMSESASGEANSDTDSGDKDASVCPTCGQECKSAKGMRQHHSRSHGESIAKASVECVECSTEHKRWKSQMDGGPYYCSNECRLKPLHRNQDPDYNRTIVECDYCGKEVERVMSRVKRAKSLYCSRECADDAHSDRVSGEGNPRYIDGEYESDYGPNWNEQRIKARKRDNHTCQRCGVTRDELGHEMPVHHKVRFHSFDGYKEANRLENLICLCRVCHPKVESWPVIPQ